MLLDCKQLFEVEGLRQEIEATVDLSQIELWGEGALSEAAAVHGEVCNRAGIVTLQYEVSFTLSAPCDRCLEPVKEEKKMAFSHILVREVPQEDPEDEYIVCEGDGLDLEELVIADVILSMPAKLLCREDCKGLCPTCGINLNKESCGCDKKKVDPRLEALRALLDQ